MLDYDFDQMAEAAGGVYSLCVLIKRRIHQLVRGEQPLVEIERGMEYYEIALEEIRQGKVKFAAEAE